MVGPCGLEPQTSTVALASVRVQTARTVFPYAAFTKTAS
jgi:hypothetical protein